MNGLLGLTLGLGLGSSSGEGTGGSGGGEFHQPPPGYDIFIAAIMGDSLYPSRNASNAESARDPVLDAPVANTGHYVLSSAEGDYQQIRWDTAPTWFRAAEYTGGSEAGRISVVEDIFRSYQALTSTWGRGSFAIPVAAGGSALLTGGDTDWDPAGPGTHLVNAIENCNDAYAAVRALYPNSRIRAVLGGTLTNDANSGTYNSANTRVALLDLIDYVRSGILDGVDDSVPYILSGACSGGATHDIARADLEWAATQRDNVYVVHPPFPVGDIHLERADNRIWGDDVANAVYAAPEPAVVEDFNIAPVNGAALDTDIDSEVVIPNVGYGETVAISITGGEYSKDGGAFTSSAGTYQWGEELVVRVHSSTIVDDTESAELTVGTKSATFNVTTLAPEAYIVPQGGILNIDGEAFIVPGGILLEAA